MSNQEIAARLERIQNSDILQIEDIDWLVAQVKEKLNGGVVCSRCRPTNCEQSCTDSFTRE